ncbi:hypothetical protein R69658_05465 [Paraburkholderia aspalathi]|uniref:Uncharacterized protein n=1 Tax=Paraburkholderia aspalathi TaxID=1324617 RepID=A0ABN7MLG3_9BURK|nr:hypothetical protein R69746_02248 [Paraburkholderia aspalathi]CAE6799840.1 hypothetical protein R20943_05175 [Paraburkholderia aspalathi]CAE6812400.1 hypothetical protein R69658_05465 [Paraburkholderia aspalathi]
MNILICLKDVYLCDPVRLSWRARCVAPFYL